MARSDQLQRQADQTRKQLAATLDQLRGQLTPARVCREALDAARRSTAARFATNLGMDARNNAVPLVGLAASIVWVILSEHRRPGAAPAGSYDRARDVAGRLFDAAGSLASGAVRTGADAARSISQTASSTAERVSESSSAAVASTRSASDQVQQRFTTAARTTGRGGRAIIDAASSAARQATLTAGSAYRLTRNDPIFAAGIGLAVIGAAAAVFGWSRSSVDGQSVGDLTDAARRERQTAAEPKLSPIPQDEASIAPEAAAPMIYDRTGAELGIDNSVSK